MCEKLGAKCLRSDAKTMHHRLTILTGYINLEMVVNIGIL